MSVCTECCSWDAPLNWKPVGLLEGKRAHVPGAQVVMTFQQHLFYHLHVVLHQTNPDGSTVWGGELTQRLQ